MKSLNGLLMETHQFRLWVKIEALRSVHFGVQSMARYLKAINDPMCVIPAQAEAQGLFPGDFPPLMSIPTVSRTG